MGVAIMWLYLLILLGHKISAVSENTLHNVCLIHMMFSDMREASILQVYLLEVRQGPLCYEDTKAEKFCNNMRPNYTETAINFQIQKLYA